VRFTKPGLTKVVEATNPKTVSVLEAAGWTAEAAQGEPIGTPDKTWKNDDLKAYAAEHSIDLGDASKKEDYLAAIELHLEGSGE
jgi:hypothetical protein